MRTLHAFLACMLAGWAAPAPAAFEIRPFDPVPSVHLPGDLMPPFGWPGGAPGSGCLGALHLNPFSLPDLSFDAAALARPWGGFSCRAGLARLGLPGYAEWEASLGVSTPIGLGGQASLLAMQSREGLLPDAGPAAGQAGSLSLGWSRTWRTRWRGTLWVRDLLRSPGAAALGVFPVPACRLEVRAGRAWSFSFTRTWLRSPRALARSAWGVRYTPLASLTFGHQGGSNAEGGTHWFSAQAGPATAGAWFAQTGAGLPASPGFALVLRGSETVEGRAGAEAAADTLRAQPPSLAEGPPALPWAGELDAPVLLDGRILACWITADSLGARTDSLEGDTPAVRPKAPLPAAPPAPLAIDQAGEQDLMRLGGLPPDSARILQAFLRGEAGDRLRDLKAVPPGLRASLLRVAPYLTDAGWSAAPDSAADSRFTWSRSLRAGKGRSPRTQNDFDLRQNLGWGRLQARLSAEEGSSLARMRGMASLDAGAVQVCLGRAGPPLLWGLGLLARGAPVSLRSGQGKPGAPAHEGTPGPSLFSPSLAGTERFAGVASGDPAGGLCWFGLRQEETNSAGFVRRGSSGTVGLLLQGTSRSPLAKSLWLARRSPGEEVSAELVTRGTPPAVLGLRWSAARPWGPVEGPLWWDLFFQELLGRQASGPGATTSAEAAAERLRRIRAGLRWRGQTVSAEILTRARSTGGIIASSAKRTRTSRLNLSGALGPGWRWDFRAEEAGQSWSVRLPDESQGQKGTDRDQRTWRLRVHLETRGRILRSRGFTGVEAGAQQRISHNAEGLERRTFSPWWGFYLTSRLFHRCEWSAGLLEARSPPGSTLSLAPAWVGGTRFSLGGRGLYGAAAARCRLGPCRLRLRAIWPCWREESGSPGAGTGAELSMQMGS